MFFLTKCIFWLALVYAAILYGVGPMGSFEDGRFQGNKLVHANAGPALRPDATALHSVADAAAKSVAGLCAAHAADCFKDAARLTALFETRTAEGSTRGESRKLPSAMGRESAPTSGTMLAPREIPRPVPDPRRQVPAFKLTPKS